MQQRIPYSGNGSNGSIAAAQDDPHAKDHRTVVMALIGEFDVSSRERLRVALNRVESAHGVVLDLSEVRYLDSTAIGEFIRLHKARKARSLERETVVIPNASLRKIFDILRLDEVFDFADTLPDAVRQNDGLLDLDFIADVEAAPRANAS